MSRKLAERTQTICKFFVGGIFIYASLSKIVDIDIFIIHIRNFMILPEHLIRVTAYVLPWIELIFGVLLVLNIMKIISLKSGISLEYYD